MTGKDIDESVLKKSNFLKPGIVFGILWVVLGIVLGVVMLINYEELFEGPAGRAANSNLTAIIAIITMSIMLCGLMAMIFLIIGICNKVRIKNYISSHNEDEIMEAIHNANFVYSRGNNPITIFTNDFIYEVGVGFITSNYDLAYGYRYKSSTSIVGITITGKRESFCRGIYLNSDEKMQAFRVLQAYNPEILLGYTADNLKEHKNRMKQYKRG